MSQNSQQSPVLRPRIAVVGATSAIAGYCVRLWLRAAPADVLLIGRSMERLQRVANDLAVRVPTANIDCIEVDLCDADAIAQTVQRICTPKVPSTVLIAHGALPEQAACESDLHACRRALEVNAVSPALWAEAFAAYMQDTGPARLVVIGSVAGDRGRQSNYVYGAAKGLLERYTQGLRHRMAVRGSFLKVVLVKPGPTATPMTAHLSAQGQKMVAVENVANIVVQGIANGQEVIYAPRKWHLIMLIIRHMPDFIFNKMKI